MKRTTRSDCLVQFIPLIWSFNFLTGQFAEHVVSIYKKEIKVKMKVKETIAHESTKDNMIFYYACWFHEVHTDKSLKEELFDMAMEVGFS